MFCKICGSLLVPKNTSYGKWMACPHGHSQPELNQNKTILTMKNLEPGKKIEAQDGINHLAVHDFKCPRCGHNKAELIERSCSYTDEDNFYWMKCGKCGFVERLEGKVG